MNRVDVERSDAERVVELADDDAVLLLPEQTRDDTDGGWGLGTTFTSNDDRLLAERPPHWD